MWLDPLPKAARKCRACGNKISLRRSEFGLLTPTRSDAPPDPSDATLAEEEWEAKREYGAQQPVRPRRLRAFRQDQLRRAAAWGLGVRIEANDADGTCKACRALDGQQHWAANAPVLPYDGCTGRYVCDCSYSWAAPTAVPAPAPPEGAPRG